jgi:hypothetical protein
LNSTVLQDVTQELADNWPAFMFIATSTVFSICFLRERRAETRLVQKIAKELQQDFDTRFDRIEAIIMSSDSRGAIPVSSASRVARLR